MPLGINNAPAQFMNMMNDLLGESLDEFVLVFLDDVLIYSANQGTMLNTSDKFWESSENISYM